MAATTRTPATFSTEQLQELLALIKRSDSVELKTTVPVGGQRTAIRALGLDPLDAQIRQVFFFDTPDLALDGQGVVVRARRIQGKGGDSVVKVRPVVPETLPKDLRRSAGFRVEVDALPGGFVCSGTMKGTVDADAVRKAVHGRLALRKLFSKEQREFYAAHTKDVSLDDLTILGPIFVLKVRKVPKTFGRPLVAEVWIYPDGSHLLELSTRCKTGDAFQVAAELRAFLTEQGVDLTGEQETKTRKALAYFAKELEETP
jgi:hypothetical protein